MLQKHKSLLFYLRPPPYLQSLLGIKKPCLSIQLYIECRVLLPILLFAFHLSIFHLPNRLSSTLVRYLLLVVSLYKNLLAKVPSCFSVPPKRRAVLHSEEVGCRISHIAQTEVLYSRLSSLLRCFLGESFVHQTRIFIFRPAMTLSNQLLPIGFCERLKCSAISFSICFSHFFIAIY